MDMKPCQQGCSPDMLSIMGESVLYVQCDCGWRGPLTEDRAAAIEAWNRRDAHPVTVEMLERWSSLSTDRDSYREIRAAIAQMKDKP